MIGNPAFLGAEHPGKKFSSEYQPEKNGRPKGSQSRAVIARKVLAMQGILPDEMFEALKVIFPEIEKQMTFEEIGAIAQAANMVKGDTAAYKAIMDSGYGMPKQEMEIDNKITIEINIL